MINLEKLLHDIMISDLCALPPDPEACTNCRYHPNHLQQTEEEHGQWCYMFKKLPDTLCMQFKSKGCK